MGDKSKTVLNHSNASKFAFCYCFCFCFLLWQSAGTFPLEIWTSTDALLSMSNWLSHCSPGDPRLWAKRDWSKFIAAAESTYGTEFNLPIAWYQDRQDSSRVPWYIMLDPTAPSKALLSVDGCQVFAVGSEGKKCGTSYVSMMLPSLLTIILYFGAPTSVVFFFSPVVFFKTKWL